MTIYVCPLRTQKIAAPKLCRGLEQQPYALRQNGQHLVKERRRLHQKSRVTQNRQNVTCRLFAGRASISITSVDILAYIVAMLPADLAKMAGYDISELLMRCIYNGHKC